MGRSIVAWLAETFPEPKSQGALTSRQREVFDFVRRHIARCGYAPTLREAAAHFGIVSANGVAVHFRALERKGYLIRAEGSPRGVRIAEREDPDYARRRELTVWFAGLPLEQMEQLAAAARSQ